MEDAGRLVRDFGLSLSLLVVLGAVRAEGGARVDELIAMLRHVEPEQRRVAAQPLGVLSDPRGVPALLAALDDRDREVRIEATRALGDLGDGLALVPMVKLLTAPPQCSVSVARSI